MRRSSSSANVPPAIPCGGAGRRFVGPNVWPDGLPGFRENVLACTDAMDAFARRMLPAVAAALDLPGGWFDKAFEESQFSFRLSHYPPVAAGENQFGIAPHTDVNFMTYLPQSEVPGLEVLMPSGEWAAVPDLPDSFAGQLRRHPASLDQRAFQVHRAPRPAPDGAPPLRDPVLLRAPMSTPSIECLPTCRAPGGASPALRRSPTATTSNGGTPRTTPRSARTTPERPPVRAAGAPLPPAARRCATTRRRFEG